MKRYGKFSWKKYKLSLDRIFASKPLSPMKRLMGNSLIFYLICCTFESVKLDSRYCYVSEIVFSWNHSTLYPTILQKSYLRKKKNKKKLLDSGHRSTSESAFGISTCFSLSSSVIFNQWMSKRKRKQSLKYFS